MITLYFQYVPIVSITEHSCPCLLTTYLHLRIFTLQRFCENGQKVLVVNIQNRKDAFKQWPFLGL